MSEEVEPTTHHAGGGDAHGDGGKNKKKRRRRRRRRKSTQQNEGGASQPKFDSSGPNVSLPSSGRNPHHKRNSRVRRGPPGSPLGRRRRLARNEVDELAAWLGRMPEGLVSNLYRGLGGQPHRVSSADRMIQLAVRAIAQGSRLSNLLKSVQERDRKALSALLQAGAIAHADEFHKELSLSFGGHERDWKRTMTVLAERGVVVASRVQDGDYFYLVPEPLIDGLLAELGEELTLPSFVHDDVRVIDERPFCPPLDFSITSLATYVDQSHPRLTQRHEIYRHDKEAMDAFFAQIWEPESELFSFHLDFLMMHGMVELRGEFLSLNRDVMEEWLQLEPEDQRDLMFRALNKRFALAEWVLWAIDKASPDGWVAERPLVAVYRRWKRGEDWRERFARGVYASSRSHERESYSFAPLVRCGVLEMGQWGQEKFYRLSDRGRRMLHPPADDGFTQFYLTPSFEMMAPAGLAPILLFRLGELADLTGCDRANSYKITEVSIERALERGWRRDDVLQFLRENSQIGLPENVEATLKGWIGHRGDVEFHDLCLMTVHRTQIRKVEGNKKIKPYILHRFAPGMYAIDRTRREEIYAMLEEGGFSPRKEVRGYPGDPEQVEARQALHKMVAEAREAGMDPSVAAIAELAPPEQLHGVPGTKVAKKVNTEPTLPPEVDVDGARKLIDRALLKQFDLDMVYVAKDGKRLTCAVEPHRIAFKGASPVLVGLDKDENERRTYVLDRIERLAIAGGFE